MCVWGGGGLEGRSYKPNNRGKASTKEDSKVLYIAIANNNKHSIGLHAWEVVDRLYMFV